MRELLGPYFEKLDAIRNDLTSFLIAHFDPIATRPHDQKAIRDHVEGRSRFFINSVLPWVGQFLDLSTSNFIEIGPGTGSTTAPLAMAAKEVSAYDISQVSARVAQERLRLMGIQNATVSIADSKNLISLLRRDQEARKVDAVMMFAVLEHMTVQERLDTLRVAWEVLRDGGLLVVGDTPNRLVYQHGHTSKFAFFDMVPWALMEHYSDSFPNDVFREAANNWKKSAQAHAAISELTDRWGRGVSFHEFDIAFGGQLNTKVIADGFERLIANPIPISRIEAHLMRFMNDAMPDIPLGFARASLYIIFRKSSDGIIPTKKWDEALVRALLKL